MRDLVLLIALLCMVPAALGRPHIGVLMWVWTAFLAPGDYVYGFMAGSPINRVFALMTLAFMFFSSEKKRIHVDSTMVLMGAFLAVGFGSMMTALAPGKEVDFLFEKMAKMMALSVVVGMVMTTRMRLHSLLLAISAALAFHGMEEGLKFLASGGRHKVLGVRILGDNNSFALAEMMMLPILGYLYKYSEEKYVRLGVAFATTICFVSVIGTFSRGGFIAIAILAGTYWSTSKRKGILLVLMVAAAFAFVAAVPANYMDRMSSIGKAGEDASFMGRVVAWKISTLIAMDHPFFGGGFRAVQTTPIWMQYVWSFHKLDFIPTPPPDIVRAAHSIYFEVLGDLGFLGLAIFLGLLWVGYRNAVVVRKLTKGRADLEWMYDMASAIKLGLIIYAVSGAALSMAYFELFYLELAIISILRWMAEAKLHKSAAVETAPLSAARIRAS